MFVTLSLSQYISDYNGEDHCFTKIRSGGLISVDQIYRTQAVMDRIDQCHQHHHVLCKDGAASLMEFLRSASNTPRQLAAATLTYQPEMEELEEDYEVEIGNYNPVQPIPHDHGVSMIPISSRHHKIDYHILQTLHHGTTAVLWDPETPSDRSGYVYMKLERSSSMITWHRPSWRRLRTNQGGWMGAHVCWSLAETHFVLFVGGRACSEGDGNYNGIANYHATGAFQISACR